MKCRLRESAERLRKRFRGKRPRFRKRPPAQFLGQQRGARDRSSAAAAQKTCLRNTFAVHAHRKLQNIAANRIADFYFGVRAGKFARIARILKMSKHSVAKHQQEYSNALGSIVRYTSWMALPRVEGMRIVSLAPSATSILCAIGARRLLVGVTKWCCDVADVKGLPQVGDCWRMESVAGVVALRPTLVIGSVPYKQETVGKLLEQRLNFLAMNPRTLSDIYADIRLLGGIAGRTTAAGALIRKMRSEFLKLERAAKKWKRRLRVYCEAWPNPRISSPPWVAELVAISGGEMIVPAGEKVSDVQVAEARPELMVLAWAATGAKSDPEQAYKVAAWKEVPAILERRVFVVRDELLNTPGPPLVHGARELLKLLHLREGELEEKNSPQRSQRSQRIG